MNLSDSELREFFESLDEELVHFPLTYKRMMNAYFLITEYSEGKLIALAGVEKKYGVVRSWTIVKKEHWHKGIGSKLVARRKEICSRDKTCHVLLGIVDETNVASINNITKQGYKYIGQRENLKYYLQPIRPIGNVVIFLAKLIFPLFSVIDKIRS